eukprot:352826-Chlamydomonas_euryale.AAC.2
MIEPRVDSTRLIYTHFLVESTKGKVQARVSTVTGSEPTKRMLVQGRTCVQRSKTEGMKQRAGRCHKGNATAHGPEQPHTNAIPPTRT